ncbi:MAG: fibronectin type III domain-containing protein [Planctomycetes bacterium]|nr:fibronectin type III domain-containing protein [Planctomycetota bacterium]
MPDDPSATTNPNAPSEISAEVLAATNIRLRWHGPLDRNTRYHIWRRLNDTGPFLRVASVQAGTFTDADVPAGTRDVSYYVVTELEGRTSIGTSEVVAVHLAESEAA